MLFILPRSCMLMHVLSILLSNLKFILVPSITITVYIFIYVEKEREIRKKLAGAELITCQPCDTMHHLRLLYRVKSSHHVAVCLQTRQPKKH